MLLVFLCGGSFLNIVSTGITAAVIHELCHEKTGFLPMRKQKEQIAVTAHLISAFVFATRIVQFLFYLYPKFQDAFLCGCIGQFVSDLVGNPEDRFSCAEAYMIILWNLFNCHLGTKNQTALVVVNWFSCSSLIYEPPRGKTNNVVSEQVRHNPAVQAQMARSLKFWT